MKYIQSSSKRLSKAERKQAKDARKYRQLGRNVKRQQLECVT